MFCFDLFTPLFPVSREKCYKQIQAAIAKFREIKENINEGLKFYVTLQVRSCLVFAFHFIKYAFRSYDYTRALFCRPLWTLCIDLSLSVCLSLIFT